MKLQLCGNPAMKIKGEMKAQLSSCGRKLQCVNGNKGRDKRLSSCGCKPRAYHAQTTAELATSRTKWLCGFASECGWLFKHVTRFPVQSMLESVLTDSMFVSCTQVAEHQALCQEKQDELDDLMACLGQEAKKVMRLPGRPPKKQTPLSVDN
eukprot:1144555-Pelagomonas_calceolata.AAC.14